MDEVILNVQHALTAGRSGKHGPLLRQGLAGERGQAHREDACLKCQLLGPAAPAQYAPALGNNGDRVSAGASSAAVPPQTESVYQVKPEVRYLRPLARASLAMTCVVTQHFSNCCSILTQLCLLSKHISRAQPPQYSACACQCEEAAQPACTGDLTRSRRKAAVSACAGSALRHLLTPGTLCAQPLPHNRKFAPRVTDEFGRNMGTMSDRPVPRASSGAPRSKRRLATRAGRASSIRAYQSAYLAVSAYESA